MNCLLLGEVLDILVPEVNNSDILRYVTYLLSVDARRVSLEVHKLVLVVNLVIKIGCALLLKGFC